MFAGLFTKLGMYLIGGLLLIGLAVGVYAYVENQKVQIATLTANVSTLQTSNTAEQLQISTLLKDVAAVKQAQDIATKAISDASTQAKLAQQAIKSQNLVKAAQTNSAGLAIQLNTSTAATFQGWENISK
jgi:hypothetical protein